MLNVKKSKVIISKYSRRFEPLLKYTAKFGKLQIVTNQERGAKMIDYEKEFELLDYKVLLQLKK